MNEMKMTIKSFEQMLLSSNKGVTKSEHIEYDEDGDEPIMIKLWLYYDHNEKHIGTYHRTKKTCWEIKQK